MIWALTAVALAAADDERVYEQQVIDWALREVGREVEPQPEGKVVEEVLVASEDVFSKSDPLPTFLNIFHGRTRPNVVLRDVLLKPGEVWSKPKAEETERNLRRILVLAVARVVPLKGRSGGIGVLVATKDRWSFRADWDYLVVGDVLERLHVPISEINLLGRALQVTFDPYLKQDTLSLGESFFDPRVLDSRISFYERASIIINRFTGRVEGTEGAVQVARPLYTLDQKWGFQATAVWDARRWRFFRGHEVWQLRYPFETPVGQRVPYIYDGRVVDVVAAGTRRFGEAWKADVTGAIGGYTRAYSMPGAEELPADVVTWFTSTRLPRSEDATYLYGQLTVFRPRYQVLQNMETLGLSEDWEVGPRLVLAARYAVPVFTPNHYLALGGALQWRFLIGDDLLRLAAAAVMRIVPTGEPVNQHYAFEVMNMFPLFEGGRFVVRLLGDFRRRDLNNNQFVVSAGSGLRGVPSSDALFGRNMVLGNLEYRSRAFVLATLHVGFVFFYDVGSAWDEGPPQLTHSVGMGLRILLPQFNTQVIRLDLGFILGSPSPLSVDRLSSTFGQVTQLRPDFFDDPL
jgi:hypothetical protein